MKRFFSIAILVLLTTLNSGIHSDNYIYNELTDKKTYVYWKNKVWKVTQYGADSENEGNLFTFTGNVAAQLSISHFLYAYTAFSSKYTEPTIEGTWTLRAEIKAKFAPDGEPFVETGEIVGKKGGMADKGDHPDTDWLNSYNPIFTFVACDSYANAEVTIPIDSTGEKHNSIAYTPSITDNVHWVKEKR